jgi:hypothetical protein
VFDRGVESEFVMAGLVPAIYDVLHGAQDVDGRDKPGHDVERSFQIDGLIA